MTRDSGKLQPVVGEMELGEEKLQPLAAESAGPADGKEWERAQ